MKRLERKHALAIRWYHWINFPLLAIMIWSGTLIYWANAVYRIGIGRFTLLKMTFPQPVWNALHVSYRLAEGMAFHFFFMWLFAINGLLYVLYTIVSGEWRQMDRLPGWFVGPWSVRTVEREKSSHVARAWSRSWARA